MIAPPSALAWASCALVTSASYRMAQRRSTLFRLASRRSAPTRSHPIRLASARSTPHKLASLRYARLRSMLRRSAPSRSALCSLTLEKLRFPAWYFLFMGAFKIHYDRYMLPLIPFLAIIGGHGTISILESITTVHFRGFLKRKNTVLSLMKIYRIRAK